MSLLLVLVAVLGLVGCNRYAAPRYSVSAETIATLRAHRGQTLAVGAFTAAAPGRTSIVCRGVGPITTPDGEPFEEFVRKAFIAELTLAELYAPTAPVTLTGSLDRLDFSSGWTDAGWTIAVTIVSTNGRRVSVDELYRFPGSFGGESACQQTAQALLPAVQNVVRKVVQHPDFPAMLR